MSDPPLSVLATQLLSQCYLFKCLWTQHTAASHRVGALDMFPARPEAEDDERGEGQAVEQPGCEAEEVDEGADVTRDDHR